MHDQRPTGPEVHAGEHPLARLGFVIGQRPTGEVHGRVTGVVQLDPVADIPLIILQPIAVGGEKLVDDHLAKCVVGLHIVVPALGNQLVRLRCDIRHAVAFRPGDGHRAALHRFKLNLPRPAGHTGNRQRRLAIDAQVGGIETTYRFTEKQAHPVQPAYRAARWWQDGGQRRRHVIDNPIPVGGRSGGGIHRVGWPRHVHDAVVGIPRQCGLMKIARRKRERPQGAPATELHRGIAVEPQVIGIHPGDLLVESNGHLPQHAHVARGRIKRGHLGWRLVRLKRPQLGVHHEIAAGHPDVKAHDRDHVFALGQEQRRILNGKRLEGAGLVAHCSHRVVVRIGRTTHVEHLLLIDPHREPVIVVDDKVHLGDVVRVGHRECLAEEHRGVFVPHVVQRGAATAIAIAERRRAILPVAVVELGLRPLQVTARGMVVALVVIPLGPALEDGSRVSRMNEPCTDHTSQCGQHKQLSFHFKLGVTPFCGSSP